MVKKNIVAATACIKRIETLKSEIAIKRDALRNIYDELESVVNSLDEGVEEMEDGLKSIESGLDQMSQYL